MLLKVVEKFESVKSGFNVIAQILAIYSEKHQCFAIYSLFVTIIQIFGSFSEIFIGPIVYQNFKLIRTRTSSKDYFIGLKMTRLNNKIIIHQKSHNISQ